MGERRSVTIRAFDPTDDTLLTTDEDVVARRPEVIPLDRDTADNYGRVLTTNDRYVAEGRDMPFNRNIVKSMHQAFKLKDRAQRQEEFKSLMDSWQRYNALSPPRGDWGDAGGAPAEWARTDKPRGEPASLTQSKEDYWWEKNPSGITSDEDDATPQPSELRQDWSDGSGASDAWWPDANDIKDVSDDDRKRLAEKPEPQGVREYVRDLTGVGKNGNGPRQDWMDAKGGTRARDKKPRAGRVSPEKPLFESPEAARAWAKSIFDGDSKKVASNQVHSDSGEKWKDDELLAALATMDSRTFSNNLGRAGLTIGGAIAGRKPDYTFYDHMDEQADQPVKNLQAVRASERQHRTDVSAEAKAKREENMRRLDTQETEAVQEVLVQVDPSFAETARKMTGEQILQTFPMLKERADANLSLKLREMQEEGDTKRARLNAASHERIASSRSDNKNAFAEVFSQMAENKAEELRIKKGQLTSGMWESKDPAIVMDPTSKRQLEGITQHTMNLLDFLDKVEGEYKRGGGRILPGKERELLDGYRTSVLTEQQKLNENGVLSGDDLKVLERQFKDPVTLRGTIFSDEFRQSIDGMRDRAQTNLVRKGDAMGQRLRANPLGGSQPIQDPRPKDGKPAQKRVKNKTTGKTGTWDGVTALPDGWEVING